MTRPHYDREDHAGCGRRRIALPSQRRSFVVHRLHAAGRRERLSAEHCVCAGESRISRPAQSTLADFNHQVIRDSAGSRAFPGRRRGCLRADAIVRVSDFNYAAARVRCGFRSMRATYTPVKDMTLYGNYGVLLSLGPQAPWWVDNANQFLGPFFTRQSEVGVKYERQILLTAAHFQYAAAVLLSACDSSCRTLSAQAIFRPAETLRRAISALSRTDTRRTTALN